ncbi:MAG TPA: 4-hydroxythreonine-4-phosphate dehydrogenase PdxA [Geminicoccus sp.]|jgi:4-hydroxythreonine-4-phosphate dehydrogenase|uniref:4-hydroxythreonine-4-phosphate dehydrogenase PdxA n=1 Tax=Geminicoccus sp. TaxID=2024832 RepID=UPI002E323FB0|nr:4-hydroxythreonine-4-phosphate dehydrogenase PdxA [Geminicoccus sp.]HEX2528189.1 4-hydroxythreonine-4-phosphate dehydrogenase PdxA [Geminicoccus sp.]
MAAGTPRAMLILADDLTGAADCGAVCRHHGLSAFVAIDPMASAEADVLSLDADTRSLDARDAADRTRRLVELTAATPARLFFKKVDSTLRGHLGVELAATLQARRKITDRRTLAVLAPAFPAADRVTLGGRQFVKGVPLEETEIWRREGSGPDAAIARLLEPAGLRHAHLPLADLRSGTLAARLAGLNDVPDVLVCDAETDADLAALARAALALGDDIVWSGSAGLAGHLIDAAGLRPGPAPATPILEPGPLLFVVGSMSTVSREQAATLAAEADLSLLPVPVSALLGDHAVLARSEWPVRLHQAIAACRDVVLLPRADVPDDPHHALALRHALAALVAPISQHLGGLFVTGGETARAVLSALQVRGLYLHRELEPGIPLATAQAPRPFAVVTKAGAFGQPRTMIDVRHALSDLLAGSPVSSLSTKRNSAMNRPLIAITMGDAAGIGAEVIMKSLAHADLYGRCRPLVVGDAGRLEAAGRIVGTQLSVRPLTEDQVADGTYRHGTVDCVDLKLIPADLPWGRISPVAGDASFRFIETATRLAMQGKVDAICTAPINKEALHAGGHRYPGHTELLAELTGTEEVSMMLTAPGLRVIHVTVHIGLIDAVAKIEPGLVERTITRGYQVLERAGVPRKKIGVCGINPHAGENGLFGYREEETKIVPAVEACRAKGMDVEGPLPADTLFFRAGRGDFDMVVAMYHDQGHTPVKVLGIESGVNITVGLPVIRTSVDHGTAFDVAGKGIADERSLLEALRQAIALTAAPAPQ